MGWKTIEVFTDEYIQLYLNNLLIKRMNEKILVNLSEIDTLIIHNTHSKISFNLLNALMKESINVIIMDNKHIPSGFLIPISGHHASLKILESQINWTHEYKGRIWQSIIRNKIHNQAKHLQLNEIILDLSYFKQMQNEVKIYDVTNREGHAAKVYWNLLFTKQFIRDQKAIQNGIENSILNYGYQILRARVINGIIRKGLDPRISLFHKSFTNFFALASDLMEPFRPLVDFIAYKHKDSPIFTVDIRDELIGIIEKQVKLKDKKYYLNSAIDKIIDNIISNQGWLWVELWD